jgi:hypothetical protein
VARDRLAQESREKGIPLFRRVCDSKLFENLIVVMILANTITLAMEHAGMSDGFVDFLKGCNYAFTIIFVLEMLVKMAGLTLNVAQCVRSLAAPFPTVRRALRSLFRPTRWRRL